MPGRGIDKPAAPSTLFNQLCCPAEAHAGLDGVETWKNQDFTGRASGQQPGGWFLASGLWIRIDAPKKEVIHLMCINEVNCEVVAS